MFHLETIVHGPQMARGHCSIPLSFEASPDKRREKDKVGGGHSPIYDVHRPTFGLIAPTLFRLDVEDIVAHEANQFQSHNAQGDPRAPSSPISADRVVRSMIARL
jgi:hypothetical protein